MTAAVTAGTGGDGRDFHRRWVSLAPPLRPPAELGAAVAARIPSGAAPVLLLGVTPELAVSATPLRAVDWNPAMIASAWPGDTAERGAECGDWLAMDLAPGSLRAVIGDGSLNMLEGAQPQRALLERLAQALAPGGRLVIRCFAAPQPPPSVADVTRAILAGGLPFHEAKLRFNMAAAGEEPGGVASSARLLERYCDAFPDRAALLAATGWPAAVLDELEAYRGAASLHCYPSRAGFLALLEGLYDARFEDWGDYPGAPLCPILVAERP